MKQVMKIINLLYNVFNILLIVVYVFVLITILVISAFCYFENEALNNSNFVKANSEYLDLSNENMQNLYKYCLNETTADFQVFTQINEEKGFSSQTEE